MRLRLILLSCLLLLLIAPAEAKPPRGKKAALRVLNLLKQVDGAGSGLDADTLRGMTPAQLQAGGLVVKDSRGTVVGNVVGDIGSDTFVNVARRLNGTSVVLFATADGLGVTQAGTGVASPPVVYQSSDCSGTPRVVEALSPFGSAIMLPTAVILGGRAIYPQGSYAVVPWNSTESPLGTDPTGCTSGGGTLTSRNTCCTTDSNAAGDASAEAGTFDLGSLGLVPPLHVEGP